MKKRNTYTRGKNHQRLVFLAFGVVLILVISKAQHIRGKMNYVSSGLEHYQEQEWLEAEESLQRAAKYGWFHYKEDELNKALENLNWITEYKDAIKDLYERITKSSEDKALDAFASDVQDYEASGFQDLTESQQAYFLERYPIEKVIFETWTEFKADLMSKLNNPLESDYNWAKEKIFLIPDQYFTQDKESAILGLFETCDQTLYDQYAIATGIEPFRTFIDVLNDIYANNRKYHLDTEWLTSQVKFFMYQTMLQKSNEDIETFTQYVKAYRANADNSYKDKTIEDVVEDFIVGKEKQVERLLNNKAYEDVIQLYETLKYFKDYTEEIEIVKKMQLYDEPKRLLQKPEEEYAFVLTGAGSFEANKYVLTIENGTNVLDLLLLKGDRQSYETRQYGFDLNARGIDAGNIQAINIENQLIGIKLAGEYKPIRYVVLRLVNDHLEYLTELEGDAIELVDGLKHLKVTNPSSEEATYTYDYLLGEQGYERQEIAATTISLSDTNLLDYVGKVVRFNGYIPQGVSGGTTNAYYYSGTTYYSDSMAYVYREDGLGIEKGTYSILGEVISMESYYNTTLQLEVLRPNIRIIEMQEE